MIWIAIAIVIAAVIIVKAVSGRTSSTKMNTSYEYDYELLAAWADKAPVYNGQLQLIEAARNNLETAKLEKGHLRQQKIDDASKALVETQNARKSILKDFWKEIGHPEKSGEPLVPPFEQWPSEIKERYQHASDELMGQIEVIKNADPERVRAAKKVVDGA